MGAIVAVPGDTIMSFLPLAHIYERENMNMCIYAGMRVGFFHGDVTQVTIHPRRNPPLIGIASR